MASGGMALNKFYGQHSLLRNRFSFQQLIEIKHGCTCCLRPRRADRGEGPPVFVAAGGAIEADDRKIFGYSDTLTATIGQHFVSGLVVPVLRPSTPLPLPSQVLRKFAEMLPYAAGRISDGPDCSGRSGDDVPAAADGLQSGAICHATIQHTQRRKQAGMRCVFTRVNKGFCSRFTRNIHPVSNSQRRQMGQNMVPFLLPRHSQPCTPLLCCLQPPAPVGHLKRRVPLISVIVEVDFCGVSQRRTDAILPPFLIINGI